MPSPYLNYSGPPSSIFFFFMGFVGKLGTISSVFTGNQHASSNRNQFAVFFVLFLIEFKQINITDDLLSPLKPPINLAIRLWCDESLGKLKIREVNRSRTDAAHNDFSHWGQTVNTVQQLWHAGCGDQRINVMSGDLRIIINLQHYMCPWRHYDSLVYTLTLTPIGNKISSFDDLLISQYYLIDKGD